MKYLSIMLLIAAGCSTKNEAISTPKVDWIGHPVVSDNDKYTPSQGWIVGYQIGFRSDGVVVWMKLPEGTNYSK